MKKPKFTPGPWLIEFSETTSRWPVIYVPDEGWDDGCRPVAEISDNVARDASRFGKTARWVKTPTCDVAMANAALVSVSPDMYAALVEAEAGLEFAVSGGCRCSKRERGFVCSPHKSLAIVRAALAKAAR